VGELRALSVKQPWLEAITHGDKRVENRSWPAPEWAIGQVIGLHASKGFDWGAEFPPGRKALWCPPEDLSLGAVVALARITGCHPLYNICNPSGVPETVCSPWAVWGQCHWLLDEVCPLAEPVPCKGSLGLWRLPEDVEKAVREQLEVRHG
jgi:ASCH domain